MGLRPTLSTTVTFRETFNDAVHPLHGTVIRGGANTRHTTARRTSSRSIEWHLPEIAVSPFQPPDVPQNVAHFEVKGQVEDHVPGVDSPGKSDSDEYEAREEELVDVEDMTRHKADETKKASKQATR